jgi:hypothetical protein
MIKKLNPIWIARVLIGFVLIVNIHSGIVFFFNPDKYAPAYELTGVPGVAAIRGFGILFLMWNVPYTVALLNPYRFKISLFEADLMQLIGLSGETLIYINLPPGYLSLKASILRFILFDGLGLLSLILATIIILKIPPKIDSPSPHPKPSQGP